jgi:hypothetical protein
VKLEERNIYIPSRETSTPLFTFTTVFGKKKKSKNKNIKKN